MVQTLVLLAFCGVLTAFTGATVWLLRRAAGRSHLLVREASVTIPDQTEDFCRAPESWVVVRCKDTAAVNKALDLHDIKPCALPDGLTGEHGIFVSPPVNGWILITGTDLPDPFEDPDATFRFILSLSRSLGHVQFFSFNNVVHSHAWAKAYRGKIQRGYAWAGRTLWNQGARSAAENELGMLSLTYEDDSQAGYGSGDNQFCATAEKVPALAARWGLDPLQFGGRPELCGVCGRVLRAF